MAKLTVNIGTSANDRTGDNLRTAFNKINTNFDELYTALGLDDASLNLGAFEFTGSVMTTTDSSAITIDQAVTVSSDLTVGGDVVPSTDFGSNLGSPTKRFKDLYVSSNTIYIGNTTLSVTPGGTLAVGGASVSSFDGAYSSLTGKPTIPTATSDLTNDSGFLTSIAVTGTYNGATATITDYVGIDNPYEGALPQYDSSVGGWTSLKFPLYGNTTDNEVAIFSLADGGWVNSALKTINGNTILGSGDIVIAGGASLPTVVNDQITHTLQDLIGFGAGSAAVTAFTTTVTPSSVTSPVFLTINLQSSGRLGTGEFGLNLVLKQDGVDVPNSRRLFMVPEMNVSYDGTNITYTHTWIPGTTSATSIELWAYNNGGAGGRIGNSLNPIGSISAIVW
jgi:hypothetical protein